MALTVKRVARLTRPGRYRDGEVRGLYLQVESASNRSWILRYQLHGRERSMGLGSVDTFSLAEARQRARRARQLLIDHVDPLELRSQERAEQKAAAAKSKTFKLVAQEYYEAHAASWGNAKHRAQFLASLETYAYPTIGELPVGMINEALTLDLLRPIWADKTETARRVRRRIASVLDFAAAAGYRTGTNPARWEGHLEHLLAKPDKINTVKHYAALPYAELPAFVTELRRVSGTAARALEFLILTAARSGEVTRATWDEIDLESRTWTIPGERMKAGVEHQVPLSRTACGLLQKLPREGRYVFMGVRPGAPIGDIAMFRTLKALRPAATVHGFRSTFRTWAEERTAFPPVVAEQALAHTVGDATVRAYRRTTLVEQRARLMEAWAEFCAAPPAAGVVTPLRARSSS